MDRKCSVFTIRNYFDYIFIALVLMYLCRPFTRSLPLSTIASPEREQDELCISREMAHKIKFKCRIRELCGKFKLNVKIKYENFAQNIRERRTKMKANGYNEQARCLLPARRCAWANMQHVHSYLLL